METSIAVPTIATTMTKAVTLFNTSTPSFYNVGCLDDKSPSLPYFTVIIGARKQLVILGFITDLSDPSVALFVVTGSVVPLGTAKHHP
jgi:hypothetical protein